MAALSVDVTTITLDARDRAILARFESGPHEVADLVDEFEGDEAALRDRLAALADNGLLAEVGDGRYERTESGRRVLVASPLGTEDDGIDTPDAVEDVIEGFDLRPDEAEAVRASYALVRYWGHVDEDEIVDAGYSEAPAGYDDAEAWWTDCVRDRLAALPGIEPPSAAGEPWRYEGTPEVDELREDGEIEGRRVLDDRPTYGSVRQALADRDDEYAPAERKAVAAAVAFLGDREEATDEELRGRVREERPGRDDAAVEWTDRVHDALESVPGVERTEDGWRYRQPADGPMSTGAAGRTDDEERSS